MLDTYMNIIYTRIWVVTEKHHIDLSLKSTKNQIPHLFMPHVVTKIVCLKVQSCKLCNIRYMIASTHITNAELHS